MKVRQLQLEAARRHRRNGDDERARRGVRLDAGHDNIGSGDLGIRDRKLGLATSRHGLRNRGDDAGIGAARNARGDAGPLRDRRLSLDDINAVRVAVSGSDVGHGLISERCGAARMSRP